jgi:hypothetical protein
MRQLFLTILFCCSFQFLHAQTFDVPELYAFLISGTKESVHAYFLKQGLTFLSVDKEKGSEVSPMYGQMKPEEWFNKKGEQTLFEFDGKTSAASFDWNPEKRQIDNISMIRQGSDSTTFEKQMAALGIISVMRDRYALVFISKDHEIVVRRESDGDSEIIMIVRRESKMWSLLPQLPKKFSKQKR